MRIQHDALARDDAVCGERKENTAGACVALQRCDRQVRSGLEDREREIVDRVDIAQGFLGGLGRGLDHVQVDPVAPEVATAGEHDDPRWSAACRAIGSGQPLALQRRHRTVIEGEVQHTDVAVLLVPEVAPGRVRRRTGGRRDFWNAIQPLSQHHRGWQLERTLGIGDGLQVRDPHRTVDRRAADGLMALRDHFAGRPAQQALGVRVVAVHIEVENAIRDTGHAVGGAQLAQHDVGRLVMPVDRTVGLPHQRALASARAGPLQQRRRCGAGRDPFQRRAHGGYGCFGHLIAIQAALAGRAHREFGASPRCRRHP